MNYRNLVILVVGLATIIYLGSNQYITGGVTFLSSFLLGFFFSPFEK